MNKFVNNTIQTPTTEIYTEDFIKSTRLHGVPNDADQETILAHGFALLPTESNSKTNDTDILVADKDENNVWTAKWLSVNEWEQELQGRHHLVMIRAQRDKLLARTDWTQNEDVPNNISYAWRTYREALRNISKQEGFPTTIVWPTEPTEFPEVEVKVAKDGRDGIDGQQGPAGQDGKDGKDGQPGRDGLPGPMGPQGPAGVQGPKGETGAQGIQGPAGKDGATGPAGPQGVAGPIGPQGLKGDKGDTGVVNTVTYTGPVTTVNALGQTVAQTTFTSGGNPILCIANGDANPNSQSWVQLQWFRDGVAIGNKFHLESISANVNCHYNIITPDTPTAGAHTYSLRTVGVIAGSWLFGEAGGPQFTFVELGGTITAQPTVAPVAVSAPAPVAVGVAAPPVVGGAINPTAVAPTFATAMKGYIAGYVDAGTFITLDNLKFSVTTGGTRGLCCATVSGTSTLAISANYALAGGASGYATNWATNPVYTTTPSTSWFGWSFPNAGDGSTYNIQDVNTKNFYRVTLMIGPGYTKNFISIERLY